MWPSKSGCPCSRVKKTVLKGGVKKIIIKRELYGRNSRLSLHSEFKNISTWASHHSIYRKGQSMCFMRKIIAEFLGACVLSSDSPKLRLP